MGDGMRTFSGRALRAVLAAGWAGLVPFPAHGEDAAAGDVLVLTVDNEALRARDVRIADGFGACTLATADGKTLRDVPREALVALRFAWPRADRPPAAWLALKDGRRLRGASLRLAREGATLESATGAAPLFAPRDTLAALCLDCTDPAVFAAPAEGVRIFSRDGETVDAPAVGLSDDAVTIELDPSLDPMRLARERVAAILWANDAPPVAAGRGEVMVELRNGERRKGVLKSLGTDGVVLIEGAGGCTLARRQVETLWFGTHRGVRIDDCVPRPPAGPECPAWRVGKDALGGPLRLGVRTCATGLGLRAGASVTIRVPPAARFLVACAGASADAAPFGALTIEILADGKAAAAVVNVRPGSAAREIALPLRGVGAITVRASAAGEATAGCVGGVGDALFIE